MPQSWRIISLIKKKGIGRIHADINFGGIEMSFELCTGQNTGFHMTFANGVQASVQWAKKNYCTNFLDVSSSEDAEVAAFYNKRIVTDEIWPERCQDDVFAGYCTADEVVEFLAKCQAWKGGEK